jgi:hypothetical protein
MHQPDTDFLNYSPIWFDESAAKSKLNPTTSQQEKVNQAKSQQQELN